MQGPRFFQRHRVNGAGLISNPATAGPPPIRPHPLVTANGAEMDTATMDTPGETQPSAEPARRRERGGRVARRDQRSHGSQGRGRPYIVRNIPTYDVLAEENLVRIEKTAERILAEIGIECRGDPVAIDHWKRAG